MIEEAVALGGNSGEAEGKDAEGAVKAVRTVGAYLTNLIKNFAVRKKVNRVVLWCMDVC